MRRATKIFLLLFVLVFVTATVTKAQDKKTVTPASSNTSKSDEDEDEDDESLSSTKVMVVPFNPSYYDTDVSKEYGSNKKAEFAKEWAKFGLDKNVKTRIVSNGGKKNDLDDYSSESDNDLNKIYASVSYQYEKRDDKFGKKNTLIGSLFKRLQSSQKAQDAYQSDSKQKEYLNVIINDTTLLPALSEKYGVEIFVFINQFEIFTNYKKVIDPVNKIYQRQVKLHFSIFDGTGQQIYGDVATLAFPSFSKDIDEIILNRFPVVANYISSAFKSSGDGTQKPQGAPEKAPGTDDEE